LAISKCFKGEKGFGIILIAIEQRTGFLYQKGGAAQLT